MVSAGSYIIEQGERATSLYLIISGEADVVEEADGGSRRTLALLVARPAFLSSRLVAELRYGALLRGCGGSRLHRREAEIGRAEIVHTGSDLVRAYAELRVACELTGHALGQRDHDADRWIAATALRLGSRWCQTTRIFVGAPGLVLESVRT